MECTLVKSELVTDNYVVTIRRQDGSEVRVMIPREDSEASYESNCIKHGKPNEIYGLNLVWEGHYT